MGLASALDMATATKRDAIRRRAAAAARWFTIASAAASTVQADIFCVEELSSSYMLYCLDGLVSQRACFTPCYSLANAIADKMYVVVRDESMDG